MLDEAGALDPLTQPDDLFGLKGAALDGLARVIRPVKEHAFGWLVAARLHQDLNQAREADEAARRATTLGSPPIPPDRFDERIRQHALKARGAVEGERFTRFLTTEGAFCRQEREAAMAALDATRVPPDLRPLAGLAFQLGVGDDPCRAWFIRRMPQRDRLAAARLIEAHARRIQEWLDSLGEPYEGEAAAFFWLLEAGEEMRA